MDIGLILLRIVLERGRSNELKKVNKLLELDIDKEIIKKAEIVIDNKKAPTIDILIELVGKKFQTDTKFDKAVWEHRLKELKELKLTDADKQAVMNEAEIKWSKINSYNFIELNESYLKGALNRTEFITKISSLSDETKKGVFENDEDREDDYMRLQHGVIERSWARELEASEKLLLSIPTFDAIVGGLRRSTLTVVAAGTSMGKTSFMIYVSSVAMLQGYNVLFLTLEDLRESILDRFDKAFFMTDTDKEFNRKNKLLDGIDSSVYVKYLSIATVKDIEKIIENYKEKGINIDMLIVDYGDLVSPERGKKDMEEYIEVGQVFQDLMQLAVKKKIWVITGSQGGRSATNSKSIGLEHTSRSFRKAEVSHYVLGLAASKDEQSNNQVRISVLKNKFGVKGIVIGCEVDWGKCMFKEIEE